MGLMETEFLLQRLDRVEMENLARPTGEARNDLIRKTRFAEDEAHRINRPRLAVRALLLRAEILRDAHQVPEAIETLERACRALDCLPESEDQKIAALKRLAELHALCEDWTIVSRVCGEGIQLAEARRGDPTTSSHREDDEEIFLEAAYLRFRISLYALGALAAYQCGDTRLALERADLSKCRTALRYASRTGKGPFSLQAVQTMLDEDEAILYYYWCDRQTLLIAAIDRDQVVAKQVPVSAEQREHLESYARLVLRFNPSECNPDALDRVYVFSLLLLPVEIATHLQSPHLRRLLISPHRLLHAVPFHALAWEDDFLIRRFAISYAPSLSSLLLRPVPTPPPRVLAVGIQEYAVPNEDPAPASLDNAEQEVANLERLYREYGVPVEILRGTEGNATLGQLREREGKLVSFSCLHFATHGENINSDAPLDSYLLAQDGRLTSREIARWRLKADLVVLSACSSGQRPTAGRSLKSFGREELPGDDLFGMQAAFFEAGAHRVLSCLWPVDDEIALQIMGDFHRGYASGDPPEVALQTALLRGADKFDPAVYYWAPFFLSVLGRHVGRPALKETEYEPNPTTI
jgi:CHAT domain-containing protein